MASRRVSRAVRIGAVGAAGLTVSSVAAMGATSSTTLGSRLVGPQPGGAYLTATNQFLTPAGDTIRFNSGRLQDSAISPDGRTMVSSGWHSSDGSVVVFDLVNRRVLQNYHPASGTGSGDVSFKGLLWAPDGKTVFVAQSGDLLRFPVGTDHHLGTPTVMALPLRGTTAPIPASIKWAPDGTHLLVTFNGQNTLAIVDAATGAVTAQIPVGNAPRDVVVVGGHAYVANQGGRVAQPGDVTNDSYGTAIVSTTLEGRADTGTVSEVDLTAGKVVRTFHTGLQPTTLLAHGTDLLVTNSNDDSVSVIDTHLHKVGVSINVNPAPGRAYGSSPNSLAFIDKTHLAVGLGRDNAVAVYRYEGAYTQARFQGLIPTGWYPGTLQWDKALGRLVVTSIKGYGSRGPRSTIDKGPGTVPATGHNTYNETGTVSLVKAPTSTQMAQYTNQVFANNQWNGLAGRNRTGSSSTKPVAVPARIGDPSKIKHVFLIVKENRTYDQVLGDIGRGNSDPSLAQFGRVVTPNHHALATRFPLLDNLYGGGTLSADGHNWLTQAFVNDYIERQFGNFTRSYPASGADALAYAKSGFIWNNAVRHGKSVRSWGEYANFFQASNGELPVGTWRQWYNDSQILEGKATGELHVPVGYYQTHSDIPSLERVLAHNYPNFQLQIPDQYRVDLFQRDLADYVKSGSLPALNMMWVMADHTAGGAPGFPTPAAQVADNDLAVGRIVDSISHSPFWKNTAIFVIEDDTQNGVDHVDGHRNVALIASPYARQGALVSHYYSQLNLMRTIEQILGLPPMNQQDLAAVPMTDAFTNTPNFAPYTVRPNKVRLDSMSPAPSSLTGLAKTWSSWAVRQNFKSEDLVNMAQLNRVIWYTSNNFTKAYPGDRKVLSPSEVTGHVRAGSQVKTSHGNTHR